MNRAVKKTTGLWILIGIGVLLNIMFLMGQTMSLINYDFTVDIELQDPASEITDIGVALSKGFGMGDTVFYIPLFLIGLFGLLKGKEFGIHTMVGFMAITVYWPLVCLATWYYAKGSPGWYFDDYLVYTILLPLISAYGLWGMWYLFRNRKSLIH